MSDNRYWATLPRDEVGKAVMERVTECRRWLRDSGHGQRILKGWRASVGLNEAGENAAFLSQGGKNGDLVKTVVSHIRSLVQSVESMVLASKPAMQPVAANTDATAREQAITSKGVLEHLHREHRRDALDKLALRTALFMSEGFLVAEWDAGEGQDVAVDPDTQLPLKEGNFVFSTLTPFDVYRDVNAKAWRKQNWLCVRRYESKYELAARFPEKADEILGMADSKALADAYLEADWGMSDFRGANTDLIAVYTFWHKDGYAVPGGREVVLVNDRLVLKDGPLPYDEIPVYRITPDETINTAWGYTNVFDVLGVSDLLNACYSAFATNVTKGALQPMIGVKGSGISAKHLGEGQRYFEVNGKDFIPQLLQVASTPPEAYKLAEILERTTETLMGLNSTARGNPPGANMAAQALALLDAKAQQANDSLTESFTAYLQDVATSELHTIKRYANTRRVAVIAGKSKNWMVKEYSGEDFAGVDRVEVETVASSSRGLGGKFAMLEMLKNFGVNLAPDQIMEVANTGQFESAFESTETNTLRIKAQCEELMAGKRPVLLISDTHWIAIPEYLSVLDNPATREQPQLVDVVLATVQEAMELWRNMPPDLLAVRGGPPAPPSLEQQQMQMQQMQMGGTPPPMPGGGPSQTLPPMPGTPSASPMPQGQEAPDMPKPPPTLPNGEPYSPNGGQ